MPSSSRSSTPNRDRDDGGRDGPSRAGSETLLPEVYEELRRLSRAYLDGERGDHTLQATALVHEAYVRLAGADRWNDRAHFFRTAAMTMRRVLVDHAHARNAAKRGGGDRGVSLAEVTQLLGVERDVDLAALDEALDDLAAQDEEKARIVELRFFAGCTVPEVATTLDVSPSTVERGWRFARAWLRERLVDSADA